MLVKVHDAFLIDVALNVANKQKLLRILTFVCQAYTFM
jgi:hypothetical protein